jgi:PII-like signaling protein
MRRAAALDVDGGSLFAGFLGFGRHGHIHSGTVLHRADETPLTLTFVDTAERLAQLEPLLEELLPHAVAVMDDVTAVRYSKRSGSTRNG